MWEQHEHKISHEFWFTKYSLHLDIIGINKYCNDAHVPIPVITFIFILL